MRTMILLFALILPSCHHEPKPPTPFVIGAETEPPYGCIEYRKRGGEC